jgi:hypothetical protein
LDSEPDNLFSDFWKFDWKLKAILKCFGQMPESHGVAQIKEARSIRASSCLGSELRCVTQEQTLCARSWADYLQDLSTVLIEEPEPLQSTFGLQSTHDPFPV